MNLLVDSGAWSDEDELAETYTRRKCFAYGRDGKSSQQAELLKSALGDVSMAYQNLESLELGITTLDHYFDTLGGIGRAVRRAQRRTRCRSISAIRPAAPARSAPWANRSRSRPAPGS
ncbi:MAG: cobaltochelatase subunit CobN [Thalassobaculum sp.]